MRKSTRRNRTGASLAEFGPALIIFFLVILFPLIDLVGLATGYVTCYLATRQAASAAGVSASFDRAQKSSISSLRKIYRAGFGKFARIVPTGGVANSGSHIWIVRTDINSISSGSSEYLGPDEPMSETPDLMRYIYEYRVTTRQNVGPLVPIPIGLLADIPGLSSPFPVSITCCAQAEHPEGVADLNREVVSGLLDEADGLDALPSLASALSGWTSEPQMPGTWRRWLNCL
jgi:hypothetical protein